MEFLTLLMNIMSLISEACRNMEKLSTVLISCSLFEGTAALSLAVFKAPGGIFLHHGKAPFYLYYSILVTVVIFGFVEASARIWVSGDLVRRRATWKTILWVSILPLVFVAALGLRGFVTVK